MYLVILVLVVLLAMAAHTFRKGTEIATNEVSRKELRQLRDIGYKVADGLEKTSPWHARLLRRRLRRVDFHEAHPDEELGHVQNKSERICICLTMSSISARNYVYAHELAHMATNSVGHTLEHRDLHRAILSILDKLHYYATPPTVTRCPPIPN
jgi:hypothetical protein